MQNCSQNAEKANVGPTDGTDRYNGPTSQHPSRGVGRGPLLGTRMLALYTQHPDAGPSEVRGWWGVSPGVRHPVGFRQPVTLTQTIVAGCCC